MLYVLAMVATVVGADILFLRHNFWARLIINVGIVVVFVAFYFRYLKGENRDVGPAERVRQTSSDRRTARKYRVARQESLALVWCWHGSSRGS